MMSKKVPTSNKKSQKSPAEHIHPRTDSYKEIGNK